MLALTFVQSIQLIGSIVFGLLGVIGVVAGSLYVVKSRKIQVNNELADSAVQSLEAANSGLESRLRLVETEASHCHELRRQDQLAIAQLQGSVDELRSWVTARDLIHDLIALTRNGFLALHVDPKDIEVKADK